MVSFISTDQPSHHQGNEIFPGHLGPMFLDKHYGLWGPADYLTLVLGTRETAKGQCMHAWETAMQTLVCLHRQTVDIAIPCYPSTMRRTANWLICKGSCMHYYALQSLILQKCEDLKVGNFCYQTRTTCSLQLYLSTAPLSQL